VNKLSFEDRARVIRLLVEGTSLRATSRITNIHIDSITRILEKVGKACQKFHNDKVVNIHSKLVQCDEIWSFIFCKDRNIEYCTKKQEQHVGDAWTWVGMDADTKLVISWLVGDRGAECANEFMCDVASRLVNRVQLTTDGHKEYLVAVEQAFEDEIDYARLIKTYGKADGNDNERRYSPATVTGIRKVWVSGDPNPEEISTSYIERQNLTMRMSMRRFTRLTNAFSKKIENHKHSIAIHYVYYNFVRMHKTLRCTPAMAAGLAQSFMSIDDIVRMAYADEIEKERKRLARMFK
jgi:IS1 family transposase